MVEGSNESNFDPRVTRGEGAPARMDDWNVETPKEAAVRVFKGVHNSLGDRVENWEVSAKAEAESREAFEKQIALKFVQELAEAVLISDKERRDSEILRIHLLIEAAIADAYDSIQPDQEESPEELVEEIE